MVSQKKVIKEVKITDHNVVEVVTFSLPLFLNLRVSIPPIE